VILRKSREFTVNMGNYESAKIGAAVELDTKELGQVTDKDVYDLADRILEEALASDIKEAGELTGTRDSFILSWGVK
jgi:hypothetical protein